MGINNPLSAIGLWGLGTRGSGMEDGDSGTGSGGGRLTAPGFRLLALGLQLPAPGYRLPAIGFPLWAIGSHFLILQPPVPSPQSPMLASGL